MLGFGSIAEFAIGEYSPAVAKGGSDTLTATVEATARAILAGVSIDDDLLAVLSGDASIAADADAAEALPLLCGGTASIFADVDTASSLAALIAGSASIAAETAVLIHGDDALGVTAIESVTIDATVDADDVIEPLLADMAAIEAALQATGDDLLIIVTGAGEVVWVFASVDSLTPMLTEGAPALTGQVSVADLLHLLATGEASVDASMSASETVLIGIEEIERLFTPDPPGDGRLVMVPSQHREREVVSISRRIVIAGETREIVVLQEARTLIVLADRPD